MLLLLSTPLSRGAYLAFALLFAYNAVSLALVSGRSLRRTPLALLFGIDLLMVTAVSWHTGGTDSPFPGQCYLIILSAALAYGASGAISAALASVVVIGALAASNPEGLLEDLRTLVPYLLVVGVFSGLLVERLRGWFRAYEEGQERLRAREAEAAAVERDMELARSIQMAALPLEPPRVAGLEICARGEYAAMVGGDFHLFLRDEGRVGLVVGDVCGKGLPAALVATSIGHLLPWLHPLRGVERALADLNEDLGARLPLGSFVTLCFVELDEATFEAEVWSAGHPPPLLCRTQATEVMEVPAAGAALGFVAQWEGTASRHRLLPGDVLLLYSDGVTEARNDARELFEVQRLAAALQREAHQPAAEIASRLLVAVRAWGTITDDATVLVCKRPAAASS
jgi:sigma-B regulation protein RsbU (phosphoserine phosphatase)